MNIAKQLPKELAKYIPSVIPLAALPFFPSMSPEVLAIFGTAIQNCIDIIHKASSHLNDEANIRDIDVDWRANFFDKGRIVHDDEMQTLWAKILAGEANNPGTYSKRSVNSVADIDKRDAELFTGLCRYVCEFKFMHANINKIEFVPVIFDEYLLPTRPGYLSDNPTYHIRTSDLDHLDNIGLIRLSEKKKDRSDADVLEDVLESDGDIETNYYGESICLSKYQEHNVFIDGLYASSLPIGRVRLTQIGKELYPICGSTPVEGFFSHICYRDWLQFIKGLDEAKAEEMLRSYKRTWR